MTILFPLVKQASKTATIETVAGREWRFTGDGLSALRAPLGRSSGVARDNEGNIYATDHENHAIVKIDRRGILHVLAGPDSAPQNRPSNPYSIAIDSSGIIYFGENGQRLRKILHSGEVLTIAGSDRRGFSPDGSVAAGSALTSVAGIAVATDGSVLFSEWENNRVRRVNLKAGFKRWSGMGRGDTPAMAGRRPGLTLPPGAAGFRSRRESVHRRPD